MILKVFAVSQKKNSQKCHKCPTKGTRNKWWHYSGSHVLKPSDTNVLKLEAQPSFKTKSKQGGQSRRKPLGLLCRWHEVMIVKHWCSWQGTTHCLFHSYTIRHKATSWVFVYLPPVTPNFSCINSAVNPCSLHLTTHSLSGNLHSSLTSCFSLLASCPERLPPTHSLAMTSLMGL